MRDEPFSAHYYEEEVRPVWLLTTEGAYSAIRWYDGRMCVRGRRRADLDRLRKIIPALSKVNVTPGSDYRYRCFCTVDEWADGMAALARTIDYGNFKSEVARKRGHDDYEHGLHKIWTILGKLQPGGPYGGVTNRQGYPPIPKGERKLKVPERFSRFLPTPTRSPQLTFNSRSRVEDAEGLVCVDCGEELDAEDAIEAGGEVYCREVGDCLARAAR